METASAIDLHALVEKIDALEREVRILREENELLRKWRFGRSTERIEPDQLTFIDEGELTPTPAQVESKAARGKRKDAPGHGRAPFPEHLPRIEVELDVPAEERTCSSCSTELQSIGEEVTERGHLVPARLVVHRFRRPKYACPHGHEVKTAPLPDGVVEKAKYDASVHAHVAVAKYTDHLPLHRMEGIFKRYGVKLPKQTLWDMLVRVDELVSQPILAAMKSELLREGALHADETSVTMTPEGQKGSRAAWVWGWRSVRGEGPEKVLVEFRASRSRAGPIDFLGDWSGTLVTDGFAGYDAVCRENGIVRAGCWAHARRKVKEAWDAGATEARGLLASIGRLFALERAMGARVERRELGRDERLALRERVRSKSSRRLVARIHEQAEELARRRSTLPKSRLGKAVGYLANQRVPLSAFLEDARIPVHNNDAERDLRHVVTGRKNWLLFASERGGEVACRLYSLVLSCKQNGVNPEEYITDVLSAVGTTKATDVASLTPWAWAERQAQA